MRKKVGLALSSGGARGLAHIGVLEVLEKEGIPIDMIAGTSVGALIGAPYALGKSISEIKALAAGLGSRRFSLLTDLTLPRTGLIRGRKMENLLRSAIGEVEFGDLKIPLACVATDIVSGEEVVIREGLVWKAVSASFSPPVLVAVAKWQGRYLVDGALVNPVPVSALKAMGADFVIAVNVIPHRSTGEAREPNIFTVIMQVLNISSVRLVKSCLSGANIVIEPHVRRIGAGHYHRVEECFQQGALAAQSIIPEIKRAIFGKTPG